MTEYFHMVYFNICFLKPKNCVIACSFRDRMENMEEK